MNAIFSVDRNWAIGYENRLLFRASGDMRRFKRMTTGRVVVMGYRTLLSLPGARPLPDRENILLSVRHEAEGVTVCRSLEALFRRLADVPPEKVFVIGGEQVYRQLLPYCRIAYVTKFHAAAERADCFLPDLDREPGWTLTGEERQEENGLCYSFCDYRQEQPKRWME